MLSGSSAIVALTIYRSGNGWLALYPANGLPVDSTVTYWGSMISTMKRVAASIPSLECAQAFEPDDSETIAAQAKSTERALGAAATSSVLAPEAAVAAADDWPAVPEGAPAPQADPGCLRIDVGWHVWKQEDEGTDIQYQVWFFHSCASSCIVEHTEQSCHPRSTVAD